MNSTKLTPWRRPNCGKNAWRGRNRPHRTLRRRNPNTSTRALPMTDWEGHASLRSGGQQWRAAKRKRTPRPQNQHHPRNRTNDPPRTPKERQQAATHRWARDRTIQQESLRKTTKKDSKQKNKTPWARTGQGTAKQLPQLPPKLQNTSEDTRKRRRSQGHLIENRQPIRDRSTKRTTEEAQTIKIDNCTYPEKPQNAAINPAKNHQKQKPQDQKKRQQATTQMRTHMRREKEEPIASHDTKNLDSAAARKAKLEQRRWQTTPAQGKNSRRKVKPQQKRGPDVQQVHKLKNPQR